MPRPITMTQEMKQSALNDFSSMLDEMKMSEGKLSYNRSFTYETGSAIIWLSHEAYRKMVALVTGFSDEVGWHGTVSRVGDVDSAGENEFVIEDIFVYPQEVTGSTVNTDQAAYTQWLYALNDETFNKIRMQGHSHCNMGVTPSGVDDKHRQQILDQLEKDMFYIFMIWNRSLYVHTLVYDMARNILYEDKDVSVKLLGDGAMDDFLKDAMEKVRKPGQRKTESKSTRAKASTTKKKSSSSQPKGKSTQKNKKGAKIQLALDADFDELDELEQLRHLGFDVDLDDIESIEELEELRLRGLNIDPETLSYYSRYGLYDPYELGGKAWIR